MELSNICEKNISDYRFKNESVGILCGNQRKNNF